MRIIALDIGEKRIGVAVSDAAGKVASPLIVLDAKKTLGDCTELRRLIEDYEVERLVIGLPLSMDGTEGPQAARVRRAASRLAQFLPLEMEFADERLSSVEAERVMAAAGLSERDRRGEVDKVAAAVFLQSYLDSHGAHSPEEE